jgi:hypothetical protein
MINILKLREYALKYSPTKTNPQVDLFIEFVESEQISNKHAGVVSFDSRESYRKLKEIKQRQIENKKVTPEEDFASLK